MTPTPFSYGPTLTFGDSGLSDDATHALQQAALAMEELSALHNVFRLSYRMTTESGDRQAIRTGVMEGDISAIFVTPDSADFILEEERHVTSPNTGPVTVQNSVIKIGNIQWHRAGDDGHWSESEVDATNGVSYTPYHRDAFILGAFVSSVRWLPRETVGGISAAHLAYTVDIDTLDKLPPLQGRRTLFSDGIRGDVSGTIEGEIWIDLRTHYILRQTLNIEAQIVYQDRELEIILNYEVNAGRFNDVPDITSP